MAMCNAARSMCDPSLTEKSIVINPGMQLIGTMLRNSEYATILMVHTNENFRVNGLSHISVMAFSYFDLGIANGSTVFEALNIFNDQGEFIIH